MSTIRNLQQLALIGVLGCTLWSQQSGPVSSSCPGRSTVITDTGPKVTYQTNEALFSVLVAINACGYDNELSNSSSLRLQVRGLVSNKVESSPSARTAQARLCEFYRDHAQADPSRTLSQY